MNLNCTEIKNMFEEKPRKGRVNHLDDYEYVRLLYENAKGNARRKSLERTSNVHSEEKKFADIHMFLREMEVNGAFDNYAYDSNGSEYSSLYSDPRRRSPGLSFDEFVAARQQRRVHSSTNSDYSFWSLNSSAAGTNESLAEPASNYSDLIRLQSRYFYVY